MHSAKLGGFFQNASMVIKIIPLILISVIGLIKGNTGEMLTGASGDAFTSSIKNLGWPPHSYAFSYDGWIVSTSICHEIKKSKETYLLLLLSLIFVLVVYVAYFLGITSYLSPEVVMELGDDAISVASNQLFGDFGSKLVLIAVVISILGTVNGVVRSYPTSLFPCTS